MESKECGELYLELLYGLNDEDNKKFVKLIHGIQENLTNLSDYAGIDCDEWG